MTIDERIKTSEATACEGKCREYISADFIYDEGVSKPALLLHSCCGPCSTAVIENLIPSYAITVYFYNPNITDAAEYRKRAESQKKFIDEYNDSPGRTDRIEYIEGDYEPRRFLDMVSGLEGEPEGGTRCLKCFRMRLEKTAEYASLGGFECFASTLCVSPYKDYGTISEIGGDICMRYGIGFIDRDYKKHGGFQRSIELSKKHALYRQNYCGCEFSKGER